MTSIAFNGVLFNVSICSYNVYGEKNDFLSTTLKNKFNNKLENVLSWSEPMVLAIQNVFFLFMIVICKKRVSIALCSCKTLLCDINRGVEIIHGFIC